MFRMRRWLRFPVIGVVLLWRLLMWLMWMTWMRWVLWVMRWMLQMIRGMLMWIWSILFIRVPRARVKTARTINWHVWGLMVRPAAWIKPLIRGTLIGRLIPQRFKLGFRFPSSLIPRWHHGRHVIIRPEITPSSSFSATSSFSADGTRRQNVLFQNELGGHFRRSIGVNRSERVPSLDVGYQGSPISILYQRPGMSQDETSVLGSSQGNVHTLFIGQET